MWARQNFSALKMLAAHCPKSARTVGAAGGVGGEGKNRDSGAGCVQYKLVERAAKWAKLVAYRLSTVPIIG